MPPLSCIVLSDALQVWLGECMGSRRPAQQVQVPEAVFAPYSTATKQRATTVQGAVCICGNIQHYAHILSSTATCT